MAMARNNCLGMEAVSLLEADSASGTTG
jgi:hypothetical protein